LTLIELLVSMAVTAFILAGALGVFMHQQRRYIAQADTAGVHSNLRAASMQIEAALTFAGYGIDPNYAVEPVDLVTNAIRDASGPFGSDVLTVQYRDPSFKKTIVSANAGAIQLSASTPLLANEALQRGQRLLVLCDPPGTFAYVTVASTSGATTINLLGGASAPFNMQGTLTAGCFSTGAAIVTRVERRTFFISYFTDSWHPNQPTRPALMVNRGVDADGDGTVGAMPTSWPNTATALGDSELLALDVEQFQVAYVMNRPSPALAITYGLNTGPDSNGNGNFVFGDDTNFAQEAPSPTAPVWTGVFPVPNPRTPPFLNDPGNTCATMSIENQCGYESRRRFTGHPGNIRAIRFTLSARASREDPSLALTSALPAAGLENLTVVQPTTRHDRQTLSETVALRNMLHMTHFIAQGILGG
jgi:type IV pilus assembly protein PilW